MVIIVDASMNIMNNPLVSSKTERKSNRPNGRISWSFSALGKHHNGRSFSSAVGSWISLYMLMFIVVHPCLPTKKSCQTMGNNNCRVGRQKSEHVRLDAPRSEGQKIAILPGQNSWFDHPLEALELPPKLDTRDLLFKTRRTTKTREKKDKTKLLYMSTYRSYSRIKSDISPQQPKRQNH